MPSKVSGVIEKINVSGTERAIASSAYGYCETPASTAAKVVDMTDFKLYEGVTIHVKFANENSADNPTLNVNNTGAKAIVQYGTTAVGKTSATNGWYAGAVITLTYDGTSWVRDQGFNTNTWRGVEDSLTSDSTSVSLTAAQGKVLKGLIDAMDASTPAASGNATAFIDSITQTDGKITSITKKNIPTASTSTAGIIKIGTTANDAAAGNHNHDTLYIKNSDELLTTNPFAPASLKGPYISKIDNAFYAADKRWTVTASGLNAAVLFDGNYESQAVIAAGNSATILMDFDPNHNNSAYFPGYPYGYILISFYYTSGPASIAGRIYCNYSSHGIGWHDISFSPVSDNGSANIVYRSAHQGYFNISQLEITITAPSSNNTGITQIEMHLDRPSSARTPFLSKYNAETLYYDLTAPKFIGALQGNADTATKFNSTRKIELTGAVTGSATTDGSSGWAISTTVNHDHDNRYKIASGVITLGSNTITPVTSVNGHTGNSVNVTATDLGLSKAMRFIGVATATITDSGTEDPVISGYSTKTAGDVVIDSASSREYVWSTTGKWELLGGDSSYKTTQTNVSDPTASTSTSTTFIDTISQNENGVITATKKTLPTASSTVAGITKIGASGGAAAYSHTHSYLANTNAGAEDRPIYITGNTATQTTYRMAGTNTSATVGITYSGDLNTGIWYVNGISGTDKTTLYNQSDGVIIANKYSNSWISEIYQDYRTGQLAIRGKNNGTWAAWRNVLDSTNYTDYTVTQTGSGASGTNWNISILGNAATANTATSLANNPSIQASASNANQVTITAGEKTSDAYTIPYATSTGGIALTNGTLQSPNVNTQADTYKNKLVMIYCSDSMTQSPPSGNGYILSFGGWDNVNCGAQLYVGNTTTPRLEIRGASNNAWGLWKTVSFDDHTHTISLAEDNSGSQDIFTLEYGKDYKLTAGGSECIFATPPPISTYLYAGADGATGHGARDGDEGQDIYLCLRENNVQKSAVRIHQGNNMAISSDASGVITFNAEDTTYSVFVGSGSSAKEGLVPKPATTAGTTKYLREDGNWSVPPNSVTKLIAENPNSVGQYPVASGNVYLRLFDDSTLRNGIKLEPGENMAITSDNSGVITFSSSYTDTKNTAGSTNSTNKLFLIGATAQTENYYQTYSNQYVFETNGELSAKTLGINAGTTADKVTLQWNNSALEFVFT